MCKFNIRNDGRRIDPCMKELIKNLNWLFQGYWKTVACCCGHEKYPMTIICQSPKGIILEIVSDETIYRSKKFYKKDKQGHHYIPESLK